MTQDREQKWADAAKESAYKEVESAKRCCDMCSKKVSEIGIYQHIHGFKLGCAFGAQGEFERGKADGLREAADMIDPRSRPKVLADRIVELDHPCKQTCSGWQQGFEAGLEEAAREIDCNKEACDCSARDKARAIRALIPKTEKREGDGGWTCPTCKHSDCG